MTSVEKGYQKTIVACFVGYIVQAIVNNFAPLLFLTFHDSYRISMSRITMLITINFMVQLFVDLLSAGVVDKIGYRVSIVFSHICAAVGLILMAVLPDMCDDAFYGLLIAVVVYAIGGGLLEVLVSPIMEACPTENKEKAMSLLHSFYCWGHVGVVLFSTIFFQIFGIGNWKYLALIWAVVPALNTIVFLKVPIASLQEDGQEGLTIKELFSNKLFWIFMLMMLCAGASEQAVSQWASTFAENGLGVSKTIGDLAGPMSFAILMGTARSYYGKYGEHIDLDQFMIYSCFLCMASYLCIVFIPVPMVGLIGCAVCGLSVGIMWPGTFSKASATIKGGGTAMFALLALAGDLGCSSGPTLAGAVSGLFADNLKMGILAAIIFPLLLLLGLFYLRRKCTKTDILDNNG